MGQQTRTEIVSEALLLAGNSGLTTNANSWLNNWLRSAYTAWPWPFLHRSISSLALSSGATSLSLGAGSNGVTLEISRIFDPIRVYTSTFADRGQARIIPFVQFNADLDERINNPVSVGMPATFKVAPDTSLWGKWSLKPWPIPDKDYLLAIDYLVVPAELSSNSDVPLYPNDRTMVQAVMAQALKYMKMKDEYGEAMQILSSMVVDDRLKFGTVPGINDTVPLDPTTFR